jgi:phage terminase small subunit
MNHPETVIRNSKAARSRSDFAAMRERFVEHYTRHLNATRAAIYAGYSPRTAGSQGHRLLKSSVVQKAIAAAQGKVLAKEEASVIEILRELARIAFLDPIDVFDHNGLPLPLKRMPKAVRHGLKSLKIKDLTDRKGKVIGRRYKFDFQEKNEALRILGRYLQNFPEERDVSETNCAPPAPHERNGPSPGGAAAPEGSAKRAQVLPQLPPDRIRKPPSRLGRKGRGSIQRDRFANEFLRDLNATQAAIRAGYASKTAAQQGCRLLKSKAGQDAIAQARLRILKKTEISLERWRRELAAIAFCDPLELFDARGNPLPITKMPPDVRRAVSGFQVEVSFERVTRKQLEVAISKLPRDKRTALARWLEDTVNSRSGQSR